MKINNKLNNELKFADRLDWFVFQFQFQLEARNELDCCIIYGAGIVNK
jgi:hypothetical protein